MPNPGDLVPYGDDAIVRRQDDTNRRLREQGSARSLAASQIGSGGLLINNGGSLTISGTGSLNVGSGALNSAGSISAGTTISAGGNISGGGFSTAGAISGNTVSAASVGASGQVSGNTGVFNGGLFSTDAYSFNITGTRVTGWHQIDGHIGTASSSEKFKTNIRDARLVDKAEAILGIEFDYYNYKAEIAKRDDPSSPDYIGPGYQVHQELGAIAERLHEAGLWEFVVYERDTVTETRYRDVETIEIDESGEEHTVVVQEPYTVYLGDTLRLGSDGEPIPFGIHYDLLGLAAIAAGQYLFRLYKAQQEQIDANTAEISALKQHLGI